MSEFGKVEISFADFVENVATKAQLVVEKRGPELVAVHFDMSEDRKQVVWVAPIGKDPRNNLIITFFSPVLQLQPGQLLGQKAANDMLRQNSAFYHGAWAITKIENEEFLVMLKTQIASTMDPEEFASTVYALANVADEKEKQFGADLF